MKNTSIMPIEFEWKFAEGELFRGMKDEQDFQLNDIYDILPLNGILAPGATEKVDFIFSA